jgi:hypothetical protein
LDCRIYDHGYDHVVFWGVHPRIEAKMIEKKDLDKLMQLHEVSQLPELMFDPKNTGRVSRECYGLVADNCIPGVNIEYIPWGGRSDLTDDEEINMMGARAEYVALCCNLAPELVRMVQELQEEIDNLLGTEDDHEQM